MNNQSIILKNIVDTFFNQKIVNDAQKHANNDNVIKCAKSLHDFIKDTNNVKTNEEIVATLLLTAELLAKDEMLK